MIISPKNFTAINYVITGFIVIALLLVVRGILNFSFSARTSVPSGSSDQNRVIEQRNTKNLMHYAPILEQNPFGSPMKLHPVGITEKEEVQYSSPTELVLVGTAVGPKHLSFAIFEDRAQSPPKGHEVFAYGETVYNYGKLKKIERSSVELESDSSTFTIELEEEELGPVQPQHRESSRTDPASFARQVGDQEYILDSRKVQKSLENPEKILTDARLLPNIRDGRHEGFSISEVIPGGMYHSLGLRNGDILLRINGLEISNPEVAIKAMSALQGMNSVNLDIIRSGKNMSMNYKMR